ncbi:TRAP transporter substrate-binding protein DctP [Pontibacterium granulatum]|uniref:TRAP transporter substrate-binding protein DctP n=1 Tax=Pontibacterium granulatum TaxID=2036029 RepID=UPI00249A8DC3|nr:TRAP transporter substrate-binding protein DctP [Pontibacterium granulatum]MDI3324560.1 TRAP transporter substrate-binding protein DctP [Pontibacterium granulatum]
MLLMKRFKQAIAALAFGGFALMSQAETWKYAIEVSQGDIQDLYAQEFKKRIEQKTSGEVEVKVFYGGTLGTSADATELVADGALQFANISLGHLGSFVPEIQLFSIPFILSENNDVNKKLMTESKTVYQGMSGDFAKSGLRLMSIYSEGEDAWATNKAIRSPQDLDNFKMRILVSPMQVEAFKDMGSSPTPLPFGEVYGALQLKTIDGVGNPISSIYQSKFFEVTDYLVSARHQLFTSSIISGSDWFDAQSSERQQMIKDTMKEVTNYMMDEVPRLEQAFLDKILKEKPAMTYISLSEQERDQFRDRAEQTRQKFVSMVGDNGQQVLDNFLNERAQLEQALN